MGKQLNFRIGSVVFPDPHVGKNPTKCAWIFEKDWIYETTIKAKGVNSSEMELKL